MNRWTQLVTAVALLLTLGWHAAPASANLLLAPGFEPAQGAPDASAGDVGTSGNPWLGWNPWVPPFQAFYTASTAHNGTQAGKSFGGPGGIFQYVNVTGQAGSAFNASAWFVNRSVDALSAGATVDIRVTFFDTANDSGNNLGVFVSPLTVTNATPQDVWTQLSVAGIVPTGAVSAQVMGFINAPGGGAMFIDDASFAIVPEPASLALLGVGGLFLLRRRTA